MKVIKKTITQSNINANTVQEVIVPYYYTERKLATGEIYSGTLYPQDLQIINSCGAAIEWLTLRDDEEYADYLINSGTLYNFIPLPKSSVLEDASGFYKCKRLLIRGTETSANANLDIIFINYI